MDNKSATDTPILHMEASFISVERVHYAKSYRPFELFVNENYKLRNEVN